MTAKKRKPPARGRLSWDGRLWDPAGREYTRDRADLGRRDAQRLARDGDVQVAIASCSQPLTWVPAQDRERAWREEIAPNFDEPDWRPPRDAPGQMPLHAELWRSGDAVVVLFAEG